MDQFCSELVAKSESKRFPSALRELGEHVETFLQEEEGTCICGHAIREHYIIQNVINSKKLIAGNYCVKKFMHIGTSKHFDAMDTIGSGSLTVPRRRFFKCLAANLIDFLRKKRRRPPASFPEPLCSVPPLLHADMPEERPFQNSRACYSANNHEKASSTLLPALHAPGGNNGPGRSRRHILRSQPFPDARRAPGEGRLFHRMKYMERRGSGLRKIVSETEKLPGYTEAYKPEFSSTATDFRVILKNVNYNLEGDAHQVIHQVTHQVIELSTVSKQILAFCTTPKSKKELAVFCGFKDLRNFTLKHINPLLESGQLEMTIPDKPKSRNQKYITVRSE